MVKSYFYFQKKMEVGTEFEGLHISIIELRILKSKPKNQESTNRT